MQLSVLIVRIKGSRGLLGYGRSERSHGREIARGASRSAEPADDGDRTGSTFTR